MANEGPRRRALVTGGNGFVGARLIRRLIETGWRVHAIHRAGSAAWEADDGLSWHCHDGSTESMVAIVREARPDVVFHLASLFLAQHRPADVTALVTSNVLLGTQLLEAMAAAGAACLVNTGTSWQHYDNAGYNPVNLYAASKQALEDIARYYVEMGALRVINLHLCDVYGPDDPRPKLLNLLRRALVDGEKLTMSPGEQRIDLVHVDDVVASYLLAAARFADEGNDAMETFAVCSGRPLSLRSLVDLFAKISGHTANVEWAGRPYRVREVMSPWSTGRALPGWSPAISLEAGLKSLL